jgi:hypothetical protein
METITVYCSQPASGQMATFLLAAGQGHQLVVRPMTELPVPDPQRRQQLKTLRLELLNDIKTAEFGLEQYRSGGWQPDAGHESGLRFDLEALKNRLRGIETVLGTEKGAADNA